MDPANASTHLINKIQEGSKFDVMPSAWPIFDIGSAFNLLLPNGCIFIDEEFQINKFIIELYNINADVVSDAEMRDLYPYNFQSYILGYIAL